MGQCRPLGMAYEAIDVFVCFALLERRILTEYGTKGHDPYLKGREQCQLSHWLNSIGAQGNLHEPHITFESMPCDLYDPGRAHYLHLVVLCSLPFCSYIVCFFMMFRGAQTETCSEDLGLRI